jgi:mannose-1-phosphate guanylyltransferase/phosphomannomutase
LAFFSRWDVGFHQRLWYLVSYMDGLHALICLGAHQHPLPPLTTERAAFALPLLNRPLLLHVLLHLQRQGVQQVTFLLDHTTFAQLDTLHTHLLPLQLRLFRFNLMDVFLNTLGARDRLLEQMQTEQPILLMQNPDWDQVSLSHFLAFHEQQQADCTVRLIAATPAAPSLWLDEEQRVFTASGTKGTTAYADSGTYLLEADIFEALLDRRCHLLKDNIAEHLSEAAEFFYGYTSAAATALVRTPEQYLQVQERLLHVTQPPYATLEETDTAKVWMGEQTVCDPSATFEGPVLLGEHCVVGKNVKIIGPAVIGHHCHLREGAVISQSTLWDQVTVGPRATVTSAFVGEGAQLQAGAKVHASALLGDYSVLGENIELRSGNILGPYSQLI